MPKNLICREVKDNIKELGLVDSLDQFRVVPQRVDVTVLNVLTNWLQASITNLQKLMMV